MLRWFPRLPVATACFSCSPPDLNFLDPYFIFMYMHYNHCHRATAHLQLNILLLFVGQKLVFNRLVFLSQKLLSSVEKENWVTKFTCKQIVLLGHNWTNYGPPTRSNSYEPFPFIAALKYGDIICKLYEGLCFTFQDFRKTRCCYWNAEVSCLFW
jgi:hypothetical protein